MTSEPITTNSAPSPFSGPWNKPIAHAVCVLDKAAQRLASFLSRYTRVVDGGVFFLVNHPARVDAWNQPHPDGSGSYIVRLGRVEYMLEYRAPTAPKGAQQAHHAE